MKKVLITLLVLLFIYSNPVLAIEQSTYEKALLSLMWEDINQAVDEYYLKNEDIEGVQFWKEQVLEINMINDLSFEIIIQVETFVGPHNKIGADRLKFIRGAPPKRIKLIDYKHIPSKYKEEILERYLQNNL